VNTKQLNSSIDQLMTEDVGCTNCILSEFTLEQACNKPGRRDKPDSGSGERGKSKLFALDLLAGASLSGVAAAIHTE